MISKKLPSLISNDSKWKLTANLKISNSKFRSLNIWFPLKQKRTSGQITSSRRPLSRNGLSKKDRNSQKLKIFWIFWRKMLNRRSLPQNQSAIRSFNKNAHGRRRTCSIKLSLLTEHLTRQGKSKLFRLKIWSMKNIVRFWHKLIEQKTQGRKSKTRFQAFFNY